MESRYHRKQNETHKQYLRFWWFGGVRSRKIVSYEGPLSDYFREHLLI